MAHSVSDDRNSDGRRGGILSDQPKPTGEWTMQTVRRFWIQNQAKELYDDEQWDTFFGSVADAHNAALASEREKHKRAYLSSRQRMDALEQQLAAEREKYDLLMLAEQKDAEIADMLHDFRTGQRRDKRSV